MELRDEELLLRYVVLSSALLSLTGACLIIISALRFRELSKRFFAIRLIFFLAVTDAAAAMFNILGVFVDVDALLRPDATGIPFLCALQAVGLLYFNLASIMWTSCFAFTLYRDVVPSSRRHALRKYEQYFHALCWPLPALLAIGVSCLGYLGDAGSWCAVGTVHHSREYLVFFYVPLLLAFTFNLVTYAEVLSHSRERRVSRITSLYLLGFAFVWLPSLLCRLQEALSGGDRPALAFALLEAFCMPLQGALNALVYGWSLPSIRDVYRTMLLGTDALNTLHIDERSNYSQAGSDTVSNDSPPSSAYSPPTYSWPASSAFGGAPCAAPPTTMCGGASALYASDPATAYASPAPMHAVVLTACDGAASCGPGCDSASRALSVDSAMQQQHAAAAAAYSAERHGA